MATNKSAAGKFMVDLSSLKLKQETIDAIDAAIQKAVIGVLSEHAGLRAAVGRGFLFMPPPDPGFPNGIYIKQPPFEKLISLVDKNQ